jgi:arylsulfatase
MDIPLHGSSTTAEGDNPRSRRLRRQLIVLVATLLVVAPSLSGDAAPQAASRSIQTTGTIGSPSATTTIPGNQLPAPDPTFGGVIKETAEDSKSWWPPRVVPPRGAPNVLLIMTDDQGYGVTSTFGGVIPTPAMDRIAQAGLRYAIPLDRALLAHARRPDQRQKPPLDGLWRDLGDGYRLPGLR